MVDYKKHINDAEELMQATVEYLDEALAHIRAGKANTRILDGVQFSRKETYAKAKRTGMNSWISRATLGVKLAI